MTIKEAINAGLINHEEAQLCLMEINDAIWHNEPTSFVKAIFDKYIKK